jgi:Na+-translocating ferredoxin:NAD+ oxidoreductase RnfA subunit
MIISYGVLIAPFVERTIEIIKKYYPMWWKNLDVYTKKTITMGVSLVWALMVFPQIKWNFILVGMVASLGSNLLHVILSLLEQFKGNLEGQKVEKLMAMLKEISEEQKGDE